MLSLIYALKRLLRDRGLLRKMSLLFGASGDHVDAAVDAISPVIVGRLADLPESDLGTLLDESDPAILSSASDFLERDTADSEDLLAELFGDDRGELINGISRISGVGTGTIGSLLPRLTSMTVAYLRKYRDDNDSDSASVRRRLLDERKEFERSEDGSALLALIAGAGRSSQGTVVGSATVAGAAAVGASGARQDRAEDKRKPEDGEVSSTSTSTSPTSTSSTRTAATAGATDSTTAVKRDRDFGFLWWLLGLLGALIVLGLLVSQCGGDDDDDAAIADLDNTEDGSDAAPLAQTTTAPAPQTSAPATTAAPTPETTLPPATTAAPPPETTAPPPETTVAPRIESELDLGPAITEGLLLGGLTVSSSDVVDGGDPQPLGEPQSSVASEGVEFPAFGPFVVDVGASSISMEWNNAAEFDELEREILPEAAELYSFTFDDPVFAEATAVVDASQSLVPAATIADDNNLVVEFGPGAVFGDGQVAVIQIEAVMASDDAPAAEDSSMQELPMTGVESKHLAAAAALMILLGIAMVNASNPKFGSSPTA